VLWWIPRRRSLGHTRGRIPGTLVAIGALIIALAVLAPTLLTIAAHRIAEGLTNLQQNSGNVGYRTQLDHQLLNDLGSSWPIGLGFLDPTSRYFLGLPQGSIRNSDTGVLNSLMTMGVVGTVLMYLPVLTGIRALTRTRVTRRGRRTVIDTAEGRWPDLGIVMWLLQLIVGSVTLVVLFSTGGLVLVAAVMGATIAFPPFGPTPTA
jgi:hypothetical protein